jgi:hypothetical protein
MRVRIADIFFVSQKKISTARMNLVLYERAVLLKDSLIGSLKQSDYQKISPPFLEHELYQQGLLDFMKVVIEYGLVPQFSTPAATEPLVKACSNSATWSSDKNELLEVMSPRVSERCKKGLVTPMKSDVKSDTMRLPTICLAATLQAIDHADFTNGDVFAKGSFTVPPKTNKKVPRDNFYMLMKDAKDDDDVTRMNNLNDFELKDVQTQKNGTAKDTIRVGITLYANGRRVLRQQTAAGKVTNDQLQRAVNTASFLDVTKYTIKSSSNETTPGKTGSAKKKSKKKKLSPTKKAKEPGAAAAGAGAGAAEGSDDEASGKQKGNKVGKARSVVLQGAANNPVIKPSEHTGAPQDTPASADLVVGLTTLRKSITDLRDMAEMEQESAECLSNMSKEYVMACADNTREKAEGIIRAFNSIAGQFNNVHSIPSDQKNSDNDTITTVHASKDAITTWFQTSGWLGDCRAEVISKIDQACIVDGLQFAAKPDEHANDYYSWDEKKHGDDVVAVGGVNLVQLWGNRNIDRQDLNSNAKTGVEADFFRKLDEWKGEDWISNLDMLEESPERNCRTLLVMTKSFWKEANKSNDGATTEDQAGGKANSPARRSRTGRKRRRDKTTPPNDQDATPPSSNKSETGTASAPRKSPRKKKKK